jgi:hypothetical protein
MCLQVHKNASGHDLTRDIFQELAITDLCYLFAFVSLLSFSVSSWLFYLDPPRSQIMPAPGATNDKIKNQISTNGETSKVGYKLMSMPRSNEFYQYLGIIKIDVSPEDFLCLSIY